MREAAQTASLNRQPRHYTAYAVITQVESRAADDGHISARNMLSRL